MDASAATREQIRLPRSIPLPVLPQRPAEDPRDEVAEGLRYAHFRANANTNKTLEVASFSYALVELLVERGILTVAELDERKEVVARRLSERYRDMGMGVLRQDEEQDKYAFGPGPQIDCASRMSVCRAACCRLNFALSRQDVEEGVVRWEFGRPYAIRQDADGWCTHMERDTARCGVYAQRPVPCRAYDCRKDKRIWADFDAMTPSPDLPNLFRTRAERESAGEGAGA